MTNMISIARATEDCIYPTKHVVNAMAKRLVDYYPMTKDKSSNSEWISEDPDGFLRQRPLSCPVVLVSEDNCMIAIGNMPVTTFNSERFNEGLLYLMAYYYALHLTYPKCISTLLSVLQTEILQDSIHEQDLTPSYKKAIGK
ncbi:hypothetical protein GBF38_022160 [Nibea albiflora]|uniref:Uncharacterized protein n=1 Tax=Nibea albiflora TaxID=240163 RepID=A0ACB7FGN1_NIBAL|nr:hypothetical protein GBF38_022160 [Nibea albiflora]